MSLDVYLKYNGAPETEFKPAAIFIREDGRTREVTREVWDEKFPGLEPVTVSLTDDCAFQANITHNLNGMAERAGIYMCLWQPGEIGIERASQLIGPLRDGLELLRSDPEQFEELNPKNGWGDYDGLVAFVDEYLSACERCPSAVVEVWR